MTGMWNVMGGLLALLLVWSGVSVAGPGKLYVADEDSATVSVIDIATLKRVAVVPVGKPPHVSVVEAAGSRPHDIQVSPDGKLAWVTSEWDRGKRARLEHREVSERGRGALSAIDTGTDRIVAHVLVGRQPAHVALTRDGDLAYVTNSGDNSVSVVETKVRRTVMAIPVGSYPHGIRIDPKGREAYVTNLKGGTVSVIDMEARKEVAQILVGEGPTEVEFTPDGRLAFITLRNENAVAVIDTGKRTVVRKIHVKSVPTQIAATPDSRYLLVANHGGLEAPGSGVSFIDTATLTVSATLKVARGAHGLTVSRDGRFAYVTSAHVRTLSVIDLGQRRVVATVPTGGGPHSVGIRP